MTFSPLAMFRKQQDPANLMRHLLFVDVESAGLDPNANGILSVGAVTADGKHEYYGECHLYTFQRIEKAALKVNGFTEEQCRDMTKDSAHEMVRLFVEWARSVMPPNPPSSLKWQPLACIAGKNPRFDLDMLKTPWNAVFAKDGPKPEPFPFSHRVVDLTSMAALAYLKEGRSLPLGGISSGELQEYLDMDEEPCPHNGLTGAKYNREMMLRLLAAV